jgi:hypothetical protein
MVEQAEMAARWRALAAEVGEAMAAWRAAHPRASLREIEAALDELWLGARARIVEGAAAASALADVPAARAAGVAVACPRCGAALEARGKEVRRLTTQGDRALAVARSYAVCPACGAGLFPPG